jgi:hypothetical protein
MPTLFNKPIPKSECVLKTGRIQQLFGTRHYTLSQGATNGTRCVDVNCGEFSFTVVPDRCMDISRASIRGCNLVYQGPPGETSPAYYDAEGEGFMASFFGGLLTTCGLSNLSRPCEDEGERLSQHGRIHNTPADNFCDLSRWEGEDYIIELLGTMHEATLFRKKFRMTRRITAKAGENRLFITDEVENFGVAPAPLLLLYHINPGFPLLDEGAEIVHSPAEVRAGGYSKPFIDTMRQIGSLEPGYHEQNFALTMEPGKASAMLYNRNLLGGVGLYVKWDTVELPRMNIWKMLDGVDYVMALEPANVPCMPRIRAREQNLLQMLTPGETKKFTVEIGVTERADI